MFVITAFMIRFYFICLTQISSLRVYIVNNVPYNVSFLSLSKKASIRSYLVNFQKLWIHPWNGHFSKREIFVSSKSEFKMGVRLWNCNRENTQGQWRLHLIFCLSKCLFTCVNKEVNTGKSRKLNALYWLMNFVVAFREPVGWSIFLASLHPDTAKNNIHVVS